MERAASKSAERYAAGTAEGHASLWLRVIGAAKVLKACCLLLIAAGVLRLVHTGFGEQMASLAELMRYSPESWVLRWIFVKAALLNDRRLHQLAAIAAVYATTELVESYGLLRRKLWGEYLTFTLTSAFLPVDTYELCSHFTWLKLVITVGNALIAAYLGWHIERKRQLHRMLAR